MLVTRWFIRVGAVLAALTLSAQLPTLLAPTPAHAAGCSASTTPSSDIAASQGFGSDSAIQASFTNARSLESCGVLTLPSNYDTLSPQMQMLKLFNLEREVRGLRDLTLDSTLLSQIDLNHTREMTQYNYFSHPSPINEPAVPAGTADQSIFERDVINPAIGDGAPSSPYHWSNLGENIAAGYATAAQAVYAYMYQDSGSAWGHRQNILGSFDTVGIGVSPAVKGDTLGGYPASGYYFASDFLISAGYVPPASADTTPPTLNPPTLSGTTATVTGVSDTGAGTGVAGVTGVVFYVGSGPVDSSGNFLSTVATQSSSGVWTATLPSAPAGTVLHAVAVDGSGNYTDCASNASTCGGTVSSGQPFAAITLAPGWNFLGVPTSTYTRASSLLSDLQQHNSGMTVKMMAAYVNGRYTLYLPGYSADVPLHKQQGVEVLTTAGGSWMPSGTPAGSGTSIPLAAGWNLVSIAYPTTLNASQICSEITSAGLSCNEVATIGPTGYSVYTPGNSTDFTINRDESFFVLAGSSGSWLPQ